MGGNFPFAFFIASRYLLSRRKQTFIFIISLMSILGVAIGVAALVVVLGVYNGFTTDIRDKILGANAHIMISAYNIGALDNNSEVLEKIRSTPHVLSATPFIYTEIMISTPRFAKGLILRGIDVDEAHTVSILQKLEEGGLQTLAPETPAPKGIVLGKALADRLGLTVGSRVNLLSPSGQRTTAGFSPKVSTFKVGGIFNAGMMEYDSSLGFVSLEAAQELLGLPAGRISGIELMVDDPYQADAIAAELGKTLGPAYSVQSWMSLNSNLFAALQLEKIGMFIVLAMVVLVGSFSIITSLVMLVMEKTRDIAIMMSMGATSQSIRNIFILQGAIIGVVGTGLGYVLGLTLAWVLKTYKFIKLPAGVYTMETLPILVQPGDTILIGVVSIIMCFLATIYPARQAAKLQPAQALRYE